MWLRIRVQEPAVMYTEVYRVALNKWTMACCSIAIDGSM